MHRFTLSARSEPLATGASSSSSAERSATPADLKIGSIREVQRWLALEPIASCSSAELERIREAVAVLSPSKPRQEHVQPLLTKWQVAQQKDKRKRRPLPEVIEELRGKVVQAAQKLQQQAAVDGDLDEDPVRAEIRARQRKRAQDSAAEEQREAEPLRPRAKPRAAKRQNKRSAGTTPSGADEPVSYTHLTLPTKA